MPDYVRQNIRRYFTVNERMTRKTIQTAILQAEALYVYSIFKATVSSQRDDPFIKNMLINFKIASDSPALELDKSNHKEKSDLPGIEGFKFLAVKKGLQNSVSFLMNSRFIHLPKQSYQLTLDTFGNFKLFQTPIDAALVIAHGGRNFSKILPETLDNQVN